MIRSQLSGYLGICEGNRGALDAAAALECMQPQWRVTGHLQLFVRGQMFPHRLWMGNQPVSHGYRKANETADASCAFGHHRCDTVLDGGRCLQSQGIQDLKDI